jgi:CRP-like cAMP-binding protein
VTVDADTAVIREGDFADAFYVVAEGRLGVTARGERATTAVLNDLGDGDFFGEIGLIEKIPRTATVTTLTPATLLKVDGAAFLDALTESAPSPALLDGASLRLRRTHPSLQLSRSGLQGPAAGN